MTLYNIGWLVLWPFMVLWGKLKKQNWHSKRIKFSCSLPDTNLSKEIIWVHALSLGEVLSAIPLVEGLRKLGYRIVFSSTTASGFETARTNFQNENIPIVFMPLDLPWNAKKICNLPLKALIIIETDIWPNLIWFAHKRKIPLLLVNARMRPKSFKGYFLMKKFKFTLFQLFDIIFPASDTDSEYYSKLVENRNTIRFVGNLKWDYVKRKKIPIAETNKLRRMLNLPPERPTWVAGSIHKGEEEVIIRSHRDICQICKNSLLIIAPRQLELVESIINICKDYKLSYSLRSKNKILPSTKVLILDTFGELFKFYSLGWCAFVGGSLVKVGGHNLFEPAVYNIPVCWGPYIFNFTDMAEMLKQNKAGRQILNSQELVNFLLQAFSKRTFKNFSYGRDNISNQIINIAFKQK